MTKRMFCVGRTVRCFRCNKPVLHVEKTRIDSCAIYVCDLCYLLESRINKPSDRRKLRR
mgnify:CR=1 FL=1